MHSPCKELSLTPTRVFKQLLFLREGSMCLCIVNPIYTWHSHQEDEKEFRRGYVGTLEGRNKNLRTQHKNQFHGQHCKGLWTYPQYPTPVSLQPTDICLSGIHCPQNRTLMQESQFQYNGIPMKSRLTRGYNIAQRFCKIEAVRAQAPASACHNGTVKQEIPSSWDSRSNQLPVRGCSFRLRPTRKYGNIIIA